MLISENLRRYRLVARTGGSHPPNRGSIPRSATIIRQHPHGAVFISQNDFEPNNQMRMEIFQSAYLKEKIVRFPAGLKLLKVF